MLTDDVIVQPSPIHGRGVFAGRDFKQGEVVLHWDTSSVLTEKEAGSLPESEQAYLSFAQGRYLLMQTPERFVNHSCAANTAARGFCDIARRDIKEGEEITADYSEELAPGETMDCHCGEALCRKIIRR